MENIQQRMAQLQLSHAPEPGKIHRDEMDGVSDIFIIETKPGQKAYRYDVEITNMKKGKSLSGGATDDGQKHFCRQLCFHIIHALYKKTEKFGDHELLYVYDNRKNLFTNKPINTEMAFELQTAELPDFCRERLGDASVKVVLQTCQTEQHTLDLNDVSPSLHVGATGQPDRSLRTFLEMVTSQYFINAGTHSIVGTGRLFETRPNKELDMGVALYNGVAKGVRIIDNKGNPCPAFVLDAKTCAFFNPITLDVLVEQMMRRERDDPKFWCKVNTLLKGVRVVLTYSKGRSLVLGDLTQRRTDEISFESDGRTTSLIDYFYTSKSVKIRHPEWPGFRADGSKADGAVYPFQCLEIIPFQRIPIEKMTDVISRELLAANSSPPDARYKLILDEVRKIAHPSHECGKFLQKFGVRIVNGTNTVQLNLRIPPQIRYGHNDIVHVDRGKFDDRNKKFYRATTAKLNSWVVAYPRNINGQAVDNFIGKFMYQAKLRDLMLPRPQVMNVELKDLENTLNDMSRQKKQFFMYIDKKMVKSHSLLKLCERRYFILTQHVTSELVEKCGGVSVGNVLNKFHMKIAFQEGLNYLPIMEQCALQKFDISKGHILVVGIDASNPTKATPYERYVLKKNSVDSDSMDPTVVGVAANYVKEPNSFVGDYFYQPARQDACNPDFLSEKMKWIVNKLKQNGRQPPSLIFIIRDGVSEGQIPNAVNNEYRAIHNGFAVAMGGRKVKFVFCIVDKKHNKRFFMHFRDQGQNPPPSSVVDDKIVRPDLHEFFMQSHIPLKGTAKMPQYTFPVNEVNASNDELQAFINMLCHSWQIINLAPALPTPVLLAGELAKRGRSNYMELKRTQPNAIPKITGTAQVDHLALNERLSYQGNALSNTRFNA